MSKQQNPLTLARAIVSAHKRWLTLPAGESLGGTIRKALAREGRRNATEAAQVVRSALGRMRDVSAVKTDSFTADCESANQSEQVDLFRKALAILAPAQAATASEETAEEKAIRRGLVQAVAA